MEHPIRSGSDRDVDSCVKLWTQAMVARDGADVAAEVAARAQSAFGRTTVRFAVVDATPVAFSLTTLRENGVALLSRLCVDPSLASRGLGTALVADAVEHARLAGLVRIELDVRETNTRAIALYERAGFRAVSDPWDYDGGDPLVTWALELPPARNITGPVDDIN